MDTLIELATNSGIWAVLFVALFGIQIKDSKTREEKYQSTIDSLADKLKTVIAIKDGVDTLIDGLLEDKKTDTKDSVKQEK